MFRSQIIGQTTYGVLMGINVSKDMICDIFRVVSESWGDAFIFFLGCFSLSQTQELFLFTIINDTEKQQVFDILCENALKHSFQTD